MSHRHDDDEDNDDIDDDYGAQQQGASAGKLGLPYESASPPRSRCTQLNSSFSHPDICFHQFDPLLMHPISPQTHFLIFFTTLEVCGAVGPLDGPWGPLFLRQD